MKVKGSTVTVEETVDFKVIEFSKDNKGRVASHPRLQEEAKRSDKDTKKLNQTTIKKQSKIKSLPRKNHLS